MAVYEMKQKGNDPVWEFKCPLCNQQWSEYWLEGSDLHVHEVDVLRTKKLGERTFQAGMNCRCCGLFVWSNKIDRKYLDGDKETVTEADKRFKELHDRMTNGEATTEEIVEYMKLAEEKYK